MSRILGSLASKRVAKAGIALLIGAFLSPVLHAQLVKGSVSGTVIDQDKALVSGVKITLTNQETNLVSTTTTNETGGYRLPLDAGIYLIEFFKAGFETQKAGSVEVLTGKNTTVDPDPLQVGPVSSQVFVTVPGMELDKASPTVRLNLPGRIIDEIPMSTSSLVPGGSRNFSRYGLFAPGIARVLFQNDMSANGHRGRENNYMIDGTDNNDQSVTLPALFIPPEAIQEVDVQAATFSAENGRNIGAQVNVITKSGTNKYRGELWEFYRGNALEPFAFADRRAGLLTKPRLVDHQFGGAFGGPVIKNKTFFFGMIQGNLLRTGPRATSLVTIPTPVGLAALQTAPLRTTPTAQTQASRDAMLQYLGFLSDVHSTVKSYTSTSSTTVNGVPVELGTFSSVIPTRQNIWYSAVRVDHQVSQNDRLTFRSHVDRRISPLNSGNLAFGERWGADSKYYAQNHFLGYTKTIGSHFVNEARVSYMRLYPPIVERDPVTPTITITGNFQIGGNSNFPQDRLEQTWQFQNSSTWGLSRHTLKFGVDMARTFLASNNSPNAKGTWVFPSLQSFMNNQATRLDFLASTPSAYEFHQLKQAYYVQDDFRLKRNLTVNLGIRYESADVPLGFFGATTTEVLNAFVPAPVKRDTNNWGPRVGFAFSPEFKSGLMGTIFGDGKSSIRGGFGIGYDVLFYSLLGNIAPNYPRSDPQTLTGATAPSPDQFPVLPPKISTPTLTATTAFVNMPSDSQNPTSHYWSASIQRQFLTNFSMELGYNGNRSYHLIRQSQANPGLLSDAKAAAVVAGCTSANLSSCQDPAGFPTSPSRLNSNWGNRTLLETTGQASYNGVYVQVQGRSNFGLRFGANYTWSTNLSDSEEFSNDSGSSDGGLASSSPAVPQNYFDRRNEWSRSVFDRPHRMTFNYTYEIPWLRSAPMILDQVFRGWQWSGFTELQSGMPFTIRTGVDGLGIGTASSARPDYNAGGIITLDPSTHNLRTFVIPLDGTGIVTAPHVTSASGTVTFLRNSMPTGGTLGRNTFRGPGYANFNMSIAKRFRVLGDRQLQIRADFLNVFNHDNFPNPNANMSSPDFGKQVFRPLTDTRQVLVGGKFSF